MKPNPPKEDKRSRPWVRRVLFILLTPVALVFGWFFYAYMIYGYAAAMQASGGNLTAIKLAIKRDPDLIYARPDGWTLLNWAAVNGQAQVVQFLLDSGADVFEKNENGKTSLELAQEGNHLKTVAILEKFIASHLQPSPEP